MKSHHDYIWRRHPAVAKGKDKTLGERAADQMKALLATWAALIMVLAFIGGWILANNSHLVRFDPEPYILLNLCLSCFAALQCFVLLIANKRGEQIAADTAQHTLDLTTQNQGLLEEIHTNTQQIEEVHAHLTALCQHFEIKAGGYEPPL